MTTPHPEAVAEALKKSNDWRKLDEVFPTKDDEWREAYDLINTLTAALRLSMGREERLRGALKRYISEDACVLFINWMNMINRRAKDAGPKPDNCGECDFCIGTATLSEVAEGAENEGRTL